MYCKMARHLTFSAIVRASMLVRTPPENANYKMERMNGEIRDRERVMRTLEKADTPILVGMQIFHNYIRLHQ